MEGHTVEQTKEKLKNDYCEVLLTNYKVSQYFLTPVVTDMSVSYFKSMNCIKHEGKDRVSTLT
jgi:hypothetical protein